MDAVTGAEAEKIVRLPFAEIQREGDAEDILPIGGDILAAEPVIDLAIGGGGVAVHGKGGGETELNIVGWIETAEDIAEITGNDMLATQVFCSHGGGHFAGLDAIVFIGREPGQINAHANTSCWSLRAIFQRER